MKRTMLGLYTGGGADWQFTEAALQPLTRHGLRIKHLTTADILQDGVLSGTGNPVAAFFLCGNAEGQRYRDELGEAGFQAIRDYTFNGGVTIGTCAGGYLLMREVDYSSPNKTRTTDQNIGLIRGRAIGQLPLLLPGTEKLDGWFRANTTSISLPTLDRSACLLYWGGGQIVPDADEDVTVLALFDSAKSPQGGKAIAVVSKLYGAGYVAASGIHPEVSGHILRAHPYVHHFDRDQKGTHRLTMATKLAVNEVARARLWEEMVVKPIMARRNG